MFANKETELEKREKSQSDTNKTVSVRSQHKLEGKNKKSLHQKQQANLASNRQSQPQQNSSTSCKQLNRRQNLEGSTDGSPSLSPKNGKSSNSSSPSSEGKVSTQNQCISLADFSKRAQEIKSQINSALQKQLDHKTIDQPLEVVELRNEILKLSNVQTSQSIAEGVSANSETLGDETKTKFESERQTSDSLVIVTKDENQKEARISTCEAGAKSNPVLDDLINVDDGQQETGANKTNSEADKPVKKKLVKEDQPLKSVPKSDVDELDSLLLAKLDTESKVITLIASLQKTYAPKQVASKALEFVCRKLIYKSEENAKLVVDKELYRSENAKLSLIRSKLENLCRELQNSNNAIRSESLDLIKAEQSKAKEQTTKIQSTLSGVIKLFDENQQRNMSLRQENQELQTKLKSLLEHCENWEKSVEVALRQRDIENRLIKTELAKANLAKNEEKEKFLIEKQELLQILSLMQEQQQRIEGQEAKLRSDLSSYASKYDECQAVISKGMSKFQTESKRMLKQIDKSKQDYKVLLSKYESSNRRMAQLLEEKQTWDKAMNVANKKIITLEKLCRALKEQHADVKSESSSGSKSSNNKSKSNNEKQKDTNSGHHGSSQANADKVNQQELVESKDLEVEESGESKTNIGVKNEVVEDTSAVLPVNSKSVNSRIDGIDKKHI